MGKKTKCFQNIDINSNVAMAHEMKTYTQSSFLPNDPKENRISSKKIRRIFLPPSRIILMLCAGVLGNGILRTTRLLTHVHS